MNLGNPERDSRYEEAFTEGEKWASDQFPDVGRTEVAEDVKDMVGEAVAAYVSMKTGRLPSLTFKTMTQNDMEADLGEGFYKGAHAAIDKSIK